MPIKRPPGLQTLTPTPSPFVQTTALSDLFLCQQLLLLFLGDPQTGFQLLQLPPGLTKLHLQPQNRRDQVAGWLQAATGTVILAGLRSHGRMLYNPQTTPFSPGYNPFLSRSPPPASPSPSSPLADSPPSSGCQR